MQAVQDMRTERGRVDASPPALSFHEGEQTMKSSRHFLAGFGVGVAVALTGIVISLGMAGGMRILSHTLSSRPYANVAGDSGDGSHGMDGTVALDLESGHGEIWGKLTDLSHMIDQMYLFEDEVDKDALRENIYRGYVAALGDPYSEYYDVEQTKELMAMTSGEYTGVGAVLSQNPKTGEAIILDTYEGSPSRKAGLLPGDVIHKVDDMAVEGLTLTEIVSYIKGETGSEVTIEVLRDGESVSLKMKREKIQVQTVSHRMMDGHIGYLQITEFEKVTEAQFTDAMGQLEQDGMQGLVIDLRNNPGGDLDVVVNILRQLLPEGEVVSIKDKNGNTESYDCDGAHMFKKPLTVLVNKNSASASEIFAGAVQDYELGKLVGETTFGKGIVQQLIDLQDGTMLKLTIAQYFTPKGRYIHHTGIEPDVAVELSEEDLAAGKDTQLDKAAEIVSQQLSRQKK